MESKSQEDQSPDTVAPASTQIADTQNTPESETSGSFGTSRGSGLSRGKRSAIPPQTATEGAPMPTSQDAVQILNYKSEFKNPFQPEEETAAPDAKENQDVAGVAESAEENKSKDGTSPEELSPNESNASANEASPATPPAQEKATLNILPPATPNHNSTQEWGPENHRERPFFKPENRQRRRDESRKRNQGKVNSEKTDNAGESSRDSAQTPAKPQGFFGWLKSLFTGKSESDQTKRKGRRHRHGRRYHGHSNGNRPENNDYRNSNRRNYRDNNQHRTESAGHRNRGYRSRHSSSNREGRRGSGTSGKE